MSKHNQILLAITIIITTINILLVQIRINDLLILIDNNVLLIGHLFEKVNALLVQSVMVC